MCLKFCIYFINSSAVGLKICALTAANKKHKSIIKKKQKAKAKAKLNTVKVLVSKALIDSFINHDHFALANNVLIENTEKKEKIENPETSVEYTI